MITKEKAIELFRGNDRVKFTLINIGEIEFATSEFENVINAIEKQIPKKVILERSGAKRCPSCGVKKFNSDWKGDFCLSCGQRLSWE